MLVYFTFSICEKSNKNKEGVQIASNRHLFVECAVSCISPFKPLFVYDVTDNKFCENFQQNPNHNKYMKKIIDFADEKILEEVIAKKVEEYCL